MSAVDLRNYRQVIEDLRGIEEKGRPREIVQGVLGQEKPEAVFPISRQHGAERVYSEAIVDKLLEENFKQRQAIETFRQTFEETDINVSNLLLRLEIVFAVILTFIVAVLNR